MLYEVKIKVTKANEDGEQKEVKEHYVLDAETHGDAEEQGYALYPNTDADVFAVFRSDIYEIVNERKDEEKIYKATVISVFADDAGREKEMKYQMLLFASDLPEATQRMTEHLRQGYDMRLDAIRRVKITDVLTQG